MTANRTAISLLLDRSGSMARIRSDAEGGIKTFIEEQRGLPGQCALRLAQFDDRYELVHPAIPIQDVPFPELRPRGRTALLDAWGRALTEFGEELADLPEESKPDIVVFVVVTDGLENASHDWTRDRVFDAVANRTAQGWQFLFLAAGQDAVTEGARYGVPGAQCVTYDTTSTGTRSAYSAMSASVARSRGGGSGAFTDAERKGTRGV